MRCVTWRARGLADSARHVIGYHSTEQTRAQNPLDDVAGNICLTLPRSSPRRRGQQEMLRDIKRRVALKIKLI